MKIALEDQSAQQCRMVYWLVVHKKIMTSVERFKRRFTNNPTCAICSHKKEITLHVLRDCHVARHIWNQIWNPGTCESFFDLLVSDWL